MEPVPASAEAKPKKMTKAEKQRLKKLRMEELKAKVARDEMIREITTADKVIRSKQRRWKQVGLDVGIPTEQNSMHNLWKSFEWANDTKDAQIKDLTVLLDRREAISKQRYHDLTAMINEMARGMLKEAVKMNKEAEDHMAYYRSRTVEFEKLDDNHAFQLDNMKVFNFCNASAAQEKVFITSGEYLTKKDEDTSKNRSEQEIWTAKLIKKMSRVFNEYKRTIVKYREDTDRLKTKMMDLAIRVRHGDKMIDNQTKFLATLTGKVDKYNEIVNKGSSLRNAKKTVDLVVEHKDLQNKFNVLKNKYNGISGQSASRIKCLVWASNKTISYLEAAHSKVQKVVKLNCLCSKYETAVESKRKAFRSKYKLQLQDAPSKMVIFWQHTFSQVAIRHKIIYARRNKLRRDRALLKTQLKRELERMRISVPLNCQEKKMIANQ